MKTLYRFAAAGLWLCVPLSSQRPSPSLQFQMRQGQPHPWQSTAYAAEQTIKVSAGGGWTARLSGEMATVCEGPCFTVVPTPGSEGEATVSFGGHGAEKLKPGIHMAGIDVGSQHWDVRLNVLRRAPYLPFYYRTGYPKGCRNTEKQMPMDDTCIISGEQPGQDMGALRAPGDSFLDPQFGSPVHRLTSAGYLMEYSSVRMFSAHSKYVLGADWEGVITTWDRVTSKQVGERHSLFNISQAVWDPQVEEKIWFIAKGAVGYRNAVTGATVTAADYSKPHRERPGFSAMDTGGTADNTDDNWWVFTETKEKMVCAVDLNGLTPANQEDHLYCAPFSDLGVKAVDFPQITQVDSETKKRYVLLMSTPRSYVFTVDAAAHKLDYDFEMPAAIVNPHSDVTQDSQGRQVLFWNWYDNHGDKNFAATSIISKREKMTRPVEEDGGGLSLLYPLFFGNTIRTDFHFGCNWSGYCVVSLYSDPVPGGLPNWVISNVKSGSPCVVQVAPNAPFKDGARVAIGGVDEMPGVNGLAKLTAMDAHTFALDRPCTGRYQLKRGHMAEAKQWVSPAPLREEVIVARLGGEVRRVAIHRSKLWAEHGDLNIYWASPRAGISKDGKYVAWGSNLGLPEFGSLLWAEVDSGGEIRNPAARAQDRGASLVWEGPDEALVRVSASRDMDRPVFTHQYPAGSGLSHSIDGLSPNTTYYYEVLGKNSAGQGSFRTLPGAAAPSR